MTFQTVCAEFFSKRLPAVADIRGHTTVVRWNAEAVWARLHQGILSILDKKL